MVQWRRAKVETTPPVLEDLVRQIVETVHPLRIILIGSAVAGRMGPDSDLDLMIVMPDGSHRRHTAQYLYRAISGVTVPFDLIVATPSDLEKHKDNIGLIYRTILREGRTIYAA
jgi:predicted nucleotidyltransferase